MTDKSRIPRRIDAFNTYLNSTNSYLLAGTPITNAARLGLLDSEVLHWNENTDKWNAIYPKYCDKINGRTKGIIDQLNLIMIDTIDYDHQHHLLDRIAASPNVNLTDLSTFNIKKGVLEKITHSSSIGQITDLVVPSITFIGGGMLSFKCRCATGEGAFIIDGADCIQYRLMIGTTPPTSVEDGGLKSDLSSKASFNLSLGAENAGKYLYIYLRWFNTRHKDLAGPWSPLYTSLIV